MVKAGRKKVAIAVIGCGVMGSAFARHFAKSHAVVLYDKDAKRAEALSKQIKATLRKEISKAVKGADVVLLAVKPKDLSQAAKSISSLMSKNQLIISILAGIPLATLKKYFPVGHLLRIMPNLALTSGQGIIGLVDDEKFAPEMKKLADSLMSDMGLLAWIPESKMEALASLAASGLGFAFLIIEALMEGGIAMGFTPFESREYVIKMWEGALALMKSSGKHPADLKLQIASPAGTTIAGLRVMEKSGVRAGIIDALIATYQRGSTLLSDVEK